MDHALMWCEGVAPRKFLHVRTYKMKGINEKRGPLTLGFLHSFRTTATVADVMTSAKNLSIVRTTKTEFGRTL